MTFFISSVGSGEGGNLGGLAGTDSLCARLATAAGTTGKTWRAYLSTQDAGVMNAKDWIGKGSWQNAKGVVIAKDVADLHGTNNNLIKQTALDEKGEVVNGRGDKPNKHDILTGSQSDGTAFTVSDDRTCGNWTSATTGAAMVGHHDRQGLGTSPPMLSWSTSHHSRGPGGGCSQADLRGTGGDGLIHCFAANYIVVDDMTAGRKRQAVFYFAAAEARLRRDSRQSRNRPEPTTIAEPISRFTVGTSPQITKPNPIAHTSMR